MIAALVLGLAAGEASGWPFLRQPLENAMTRAAAVPVQLQRTRDGWIFIMCMTQKFWLSLCEAMDRSDLLADPRFPDPNTRARNRAAPRPLRHHPYTSTPTSFTPPTIEQRRALVFCDSRRGQSQGPAPPGGTSRC